MTDWPMVVAVAILVVLAGSQLPRLARRLGEEQRDIKYGGLPAEADE